MRLEDRMNNFEEDIITMAHHVRKAIKLALDALQTNDKNKALEVVELDEYINHDDENINDQAIEILSLMQPVAKDLRWLVGGIKIATDLERIGDYAKNIGRYIIKSYDIDPKYNEAINHLGTLFLSNFDAVVEVLNSRDVKKCYDVANLDDNLDREFKILMEKFAEESTTSHRFPVEVSTMLRNIERGGDHSKNICEHIIYIVKGQHIDFG